MLALLRLGHDRRRRQPLVLGGVELGRVERLAALAVVAPVELLRRVERVVLDVLRALAQVAEAPRDVLLQQLADQVGGVPCGEG